MQATVQNFHTAAQVLEHLTDNAARCTVLIVCAKREEFVDQVVPSLTGSLPLEVPASQDTVSDDELEARKLPHPLLSTALRLLAVTKDIKLVFCSTIGTLRTYLFNLALSEGQVATRLESSACSSFHPILVILDLVLLHHTTSEFSFSGLSRTFASAVEAAARNGMDLLLTECHDIHGLRNNGGSDIWDMDIPLLSGSAHFAEEDSGREVNVVHVKHVAERWFRFVEKPDDTDNEENEEMLV